MALGIAVATIALVLLGGMVAGRYSAWYRLMREAQESGHREVETTERRRLSISLGILGGFLLLGSVTGFASSGSLSGWPWSLPFVIPGIVCTIAAVRLQLKSEINVTR